MIDLHVKLGRVFGGDSNKTDQTIFCFFLIYILNFDNFYFFAFFDVVFVSVFFCQIDMPNMFTFSMYFRR